MPGRPVLNLRFDKTNSDKKIKIKIKIKGQGHIWKIFHTTFVSYQLDQQFWRYGKYKILPGKFKIKLMGKFDLNFI